MERAGKRICDVLVEAGIDHVFGIPGGGTIPIWDALYDRQDKIKVVLARHEQAAACMADMYGRMTGKPGVLMGQGAFIGTTGGFGILEAFMSSSPMLVLTDTSDMGFSQHASYQSGTGEYGSFDLRAMLRGMSKFTTYAVTPEEAVQGVQLAVKHAVVGRPGPACVLMRSKAASGVVDPERTPRLYGTAGYLKESVTVPSPDAVQRAVDLILKARQPVVIAGNGVHVSRAYEPLRQFAELVGAPVATSYKGQSAFPGVHPLALGMMGTFGQAVANRTIAEADLVLVAGSRLSPSDTRFDNPALLDPSRQKILQMDIEPRNAGWTFPLDEALIGDLGHTLDLMVQALRKSPPAGAGDRTAAVLERKKAESFHEAPELYAETRPLLPQRIVKEIEEAVDGSAIITLDAGNSRLWMSHFFKTKQVRTLFCPGGVAGMAWGPPAALTAKLLCPDRPVVSVVGDGGFAMTLHVLSTAVQYGLPVVFVVMNNSVLGMVRDFQAARQRIIASEFGATDFARIARGFGCRGVDVQAPGQLVAAIREAFDQDLPTVIDVTTSAVEPFFKIAALEDFARVA